MGDPLLLSVDWNGDPDLQSGVWQFIQPSVKVGYGKKHILGLLISFVMLGTIMGVEVLGPAGLYVLMYTPAVFFS